MKRIKALWLICAVQFLVLVTATYPTFTSWLQGNSSFTVYLTAIFGPSEHVLDMIFYGILYTASIIILVLTFGMKNHVEEG